METMKIKITLTEGLLGTAPANPEIYREFIGSKSPDAQTIEEEVSAIGADAVFEKAMTIFPKLDDGTPFLFDYQVKGFFKDACSMLARVKGENATLSSRLKAYKKIIDGMIFVEPRMVPILFDGEIGICQRPLRANTMQGERIALSSSEEIPAGATLQFDVVVLDKNHLNLVREWLDYGALRGIGQWRNSGKGRFTYEELEDTAQEKTGMPDEQI